ncbi:MAG: CHAD domain-containing protein [Candidatus Binatus sp.]
MVVKEHMAAMKAERIALVKDASVEDAIAVVFAGCLKHWTANEPAALSGLDPEGVHEMRVALRRMRVALSDFKEIIPVAQVEWLKCESKWLLSSLSSARDWDVFLCELLKSVEASRPRDTGLAELRMAAEAERETGYAEVSRAIRSPRYSALLARVNRWLSSKSWRKPGNARRKVLDESAERLAGRLLTKRHKVVLKLGRDFKKLSPDERHQLRMALKKLRYTAEFFRSLYRKKRERAYFHALDQLQSSLGHMNDIVVADHLLERLSAAREDRRISSHLQTAAGIVSGWYAHSAATSEDEAESTWREFCVRNAFWGKNRN